MPCLSASSQATMSAHCCRAQLSQLAACSLSTHLTPFSRVWLHEMLGPQPPCSHTSPRIAGHNQLPPSSLICAAHCRRLRERNEQRQQEKEEREAAVHEEVARQRAEISNAKEESFRWGGAQAFALAVDLPSDRQQKGTLLSLASVEGHFGDCVGRQQC